MQVSNNFLEHEICTCNLPSTSKKKKKKGGGTGEYWI